jgi:formylglycine-generating enzyme required for sulfatase activity
VFEWVEDWYGENHYMKRSSSNPKGPSDGKEKILRGGSWGNGEHSVGVNSRSWETPKHLSFNS